MQLKTIKKVRSIIHKQSGLRSNQVHTSSSSWSSSEDSSDADESLSSSCFLLLGKTSSSSATMTKRNEELATQSFICIMYFRICKWMSNSMMSGMDQQWACRYLCSLWWTLDPSSPWLSRKHQSTGLSLMSKPAIRTTESKQRAYVHNSKWAQCSYAKTYKEDVNKLYRCKLAAGCAT